CLSISSSITIKKQRIIIYIILYSTVFSKQHCQRTETLQKRTEAVSSRNVREEHRRTGWGNAEAALRRDQGRNEAGMHKLTGIEP
ncbi:MAG: hypothetical protein Q4F25_03220, partial [Eubacteriales bacterium]|nr:hypothetical protein [Eubacteriales bacterium]